MRAIFVNPPSPDTYTYYRDCNRSGRRSAAGELWPQAGLALFAGLYPADEVRLLDCIAERISYSQLWQKLKEFLPDWVVFNPVSCTIESDMALAYMAHQIGAQSVAISPHAKALEEETRKRFPLLNHMIHHSKTGPEAEYRLRELITGESAEQTSFETLPPARQDLLPIQRYSMPFIGKGYTAIIASRGCPYQCFVSGTKVLMYNDTLKNIENVTVGERVVSFDTSYGAKEYQEVTRIGNRIADDVYKVTLEDDTEFQVTSEHPFWTQSGWRKIGELAIGEELRKVSNMSESNPGVLSKDLFDGLCKKTSSCHEAWQIESNEKTRSSSESLQNNASQTWKEVISSDETTSYRGKDSSSFCFINTSKGSLFEDENKQSYVDSEVSKESSKNYAGVFPKRNKTSSCLGLSKSLGNTVEEYFQETWNQSPAFRYENILDRSMSFWKEKKSRLHLQEKKESYSLQWEVLAHQERHQDTDARLLNDGMERAQLVGGSCCQGESLFAPQDGEIIPGYWVKIKKITFLGTRKVYALTISKNENFVANNFLTHNCIYCRTTVVTERKIRYRNVESVLEEIEKYHLTNFILHGDTMTLNHQWIHSFCNGLRRLPFKVRVVSNSRVDSVTLDLLKDMKSAGWWMVSYGIESGDDRVLAMNKKEATVADAERAVRWSKQAGLSVWGYFMLGMYGDTVDSMGATLRLAQTLPLDIVNFAIAAPYPGTEWGTVAESNGWLRTERWEALDQNYSAIVDQPDCPASAVVHAQRTAYWRWYGSWRGLKFLSQAWRPSYTSFLVQGAWNHLRSG